MGVRYIATVRNVREVCLLGTADGDFWTHHLAPQDLRPALHDGTARILIMVGDLRWMGIRFFELSISVLIGGDPRGNSEVYMVQAFNSSRVFAWLERNCFGTPFQYAEPPVETGPPASFQLASGGTPLIEAGMSGPRDATAEADELWTVTAHIPSKPASPKAFFGRVEGRVLTFPFEATDGFVVERSDDFPVLGCLAESQFQPTEWTVRPVATHSRSKTLSRKRALALI